MEIAAPPMNLLGSESVRDLSFSHSANQGGQGRQGARVQERRRRLFHFPADLTKINKYGTEAAKLTGEAPIALLFRHLSASRPVTIAQIEGRVRASGSECDRSRTRGGRSSRF